MFPLKEDFDATSLDSLEPVFNELLSRDVKSVGDLEAFFSDISDMAEHISEAGARLYIGMTCDTENELKQTNFLNFVENIRPRMSEVSNKLDLKILNLDFIDGLSDRYTLILRSMRNSIEIFREENIPLSVECTNSQPNIRRLSVR